MTARATGLLVVAVGGIKKEIYVRDGQPEYVSSNVASELFGNYLVTKGVLSDGELAMALAMMPHYGGKLGDTLVGLGLLKPLEVFRHLTRQVRSKIIDVCTWNKGGFGWYAGRENPREAFPLDFNAFEILGAGAMALADDVIDGVDREARRRASCAPSRTRRVGPERFEVKGLVELCETRSTARLSVNEMIEAHGDRAERLQDRAHAVPARGMRPREAGVTRALAGALLVVVCAACYHPTAAFDQPCAPNGDCPDGQHCDPDDFCIANGPHLDAAGGGGSDGNGGGSDAGAMIDAAIGCEGSAAACPTADPVCDPASKTCRGCRADNECAAACEESTGQCVAASGAIFVSASTGTDTGTGTQGDPVLTIDEGIALVADGRSFVAIAPGTYTENVTYNVVTSGVVSGPGVGATATVAGTVVVSNSTPTVVLESLTIAPPPSSGTCVNVETDTTAATLFALEVGPCSSDGIAGKGPLVARHVTVTGAGNNGFNVQSQNAQLLDIEQSTVDGARVGLALGKAAMTVVRNVQVSNCSTAGILTGGGPGGTTTTTELDFVTITGNGVGNGGTRRGLQCMMNGASATVVTSSVFANNGLAPSIDSNCAVSYSVIDDSSIVNGSNNETSTSPVFADGSGGDFHLAVGSPGVDEADPATAVRVDHDGVARPIGAGFDCGAFESH